MVALNKSKSKGKDTTALVTVPESDLSKDAQARMSSALSQANVQTNDKVQSDRLDEEEAQTNRLIAAATECAEALAGHEEFNAFTHDAIEHKREEDYKSVRCYKYMQAYLSHDQRALLPWPKSKHDDAFVKTSNTPNVYDVIKTKRRTLKARLFHTPRPTTGLWLRRCQKALQHVTHCLQSRRLRATRSTHRKSGRLTSKAIASASLALRQLKATAVGH